MTRAEQIVFPPFRLDLANEQLWRERQLVPLRPKTFAVLQFLVRQAGQLVTKEELLRGVWSDTRVSEGILKGHIRDLRDILGDDARQPRFIETVPRRGHRFIGHLIRQSWSANSQYSAVSQKTAGAGNQEAESRIYSFPVQFADLNPQHSLLVGRETELAKLHDLFVKSLTGERQIVFVTGEAGIGKTTLVENFLQRLAFGVSHQTLLDSTQDATHPIQDFPASFSSSRLLTSSPWLGRGQCVEQHGAGEAYLPVLEALGGIGRSPGGELFVATLQQYAPSWLSQMPALLTTGELETLQRRVMGVSRERMLREMIEAIEMLTLQRPLVFWFEDLHWADVSTVDWLAAVAQRRAPARLMVIGAYRPSDLSLRGHSLRAVKQELVAKGQSEELLMPFLSPDDVTQYLAKRYERRQFPEGLGEAIHQRTDGNPLFVVSMVEYLAAQGVIVEVDGYWRLQTAVDKVGCGVPESLRQLIDRHLERLTDNQQRLLEAASVVGVTFSAAAVAAGIETSVEQVEEWCEELVKRGQFLQAHEPRILPDGALCGSYGFQHALQHAVVYERIPSSRLLRLHRRVGEGEERSYETRAHEIAAELAVHFERGGELRRAVQYRQEAGYNALRQHGYQEAITHFTRGLALLATFPDTPERRRQELTLQVALGSPLQALYGYGASEVEMVYTRALELSQGIDETIQLFPILRGLYVFYLLRGRIRTAHELGERLLSLARGVQDPALLLEAHFAVGQTLMFRGELVAAREHLEHGIALYDPARHHSHAFLYGQDPGVFCRVLAAWDLCLLGYPDQALKRSQEALAVAQEVVHPFSMAAAQTFLALTHQSRREGQATQEHAEEAIALSTQQGFPFFLAFGSLLRGWALAEQGQTEEGIAQLRQGLAAFRATGAELVMPRWIALLAETYGKARQPEEGSNILVEALAILNNNGEYEYEAELYRLKGTLMLQAQAGPPQVSGKSKKGHNKPRGTDLQMEAKAEACFLKAIDIARQRQAKSLELRAIVSLVQLRQQQVARETSRSTQHASHSKQRNAPRKLEEACLLLSEVYHWITEGFDTKDVQEAKALIESLNHQALE